MGKTRIAYWDNLKGILIALVVLGHTGTALGDKWLSVIYAFHMPLFVFVSGYFSRKKDSFWDSTKRLIILYLIFNTAYILLDIVLGESLTFRRVLTPSFALWYILSLIIWRMLIQILPDKALSSPTLVIPMSVLLALAAGFIPIGTPMSFQRTFVFLPFFISGYFARKADVMNWLSKHNNHYVVVVFVLLSVLSYFVLPVFYGSSPYLVGHELRDLVIRVVQLAVAAVLCISVMLMVPQKKVLFADLGRESLLIYLLHPPIIKLTKLACSHIGIPMNPLVAVIIAIFTVSVLYLVRNLRILRPLR